MIREIFLQTENFTSCKCIYTTPHVDSRYIYDISPLSFFLAAQCIYSKTKRTALFFFYFPPKFFLYFSNAASPSAFKLFL